MFAIIGILVVLVSVLGGFLLEKGNLSVLFQPAEFLIIFGAAIGSLLIASPPKVITLIIKHIPLITSSKSHSKGKFLELFSLLYQLFSKIRKEGLISIESDIESPENSPIFKKHKGLLEHAKAVNFLCDNLKVIITTNVPPHELDSLMDLDIETNYDETMISSASIAKVADALPGLGIVAAVMGIVLTMGKIDQPPEVLGHSIGAALVGTFLGVLASYGFVGPMASNLEHRAREDNLYSQVIKVALVAFIGGSAPQIAVEFGRRAVPSHDRPTFDELEKEIRGKK